MRHVAAIILVALSAVSASADPLEDQIALLRSRYLSDREGAADAIVKFGDSVTPRISELLNDRDLRVQRAAVEILTRIGTATSVAPLLPLIAHSDPTIRDLVRGAFMRLGRAVRPGLEAARDARDEIAPDVTELLQAMTQQDIEAAFSAELMEDGSTGNFAGQFHALRDLGADIGPMLARMTADGFEFHRPQGRLARFRLMAIDAIADIGYREGIPDLLRIAEGDGEDACAASAALFRMGETEAAGKLEARLREKLNDPANTVKSDTRQSLAELFSRSGQYEKSAAMYAESLATEGAGRGTLSYNLACSLSRLGRKKEALAALKSAVDGGFRGTDWVKRDGDLDNIRGEAEFKDLLRKMSNDEQADGSLTDPPDGGGGPTE